ncbi:1-phosphatidylinositol 4,5-bisphosphate phosphodiesterase [Hyalella azteca]|uniref:1-phosphatidylinositol 4,5-bisphosphate phosphodiesterase n=1 Tax=Hyalella azteca TaxID=294128 RepID=A0A979FW04_HYAAZ|nr:1-phosphatidylinositol 4,5-bisphosphate phosphodiesterase [Hyalella azteca]
MTRYFDFVWRREVHPELLKGAVFERWIEDKETSEVEPGCLFLFKRYSVFMCPLVLSFPAHEGNVLELSQVSDIRKGQLPKDSKLADRLITKHGKNVEEKMLAICSGLDYVNVNLTNIICKDVEEAQRWQNYLRVITNNNKVPNLCPTTNLRKHWMRLGMTVDASGMIPVRNIVRTFASGKTEKLVFQSLSDLGLPSEKTDSIDREAFTFDKFYKLYHTICPRTDIDELYNSITKEDTISLKQFVTFMNEKQRDPRLNEILYPLYDDKRCIEIIEAHEPKQEYRDLQCISKDGLLAYLMSDENAPVFLDRLDIYQDMDQPLSHYYINSSHNTYLSGRQFGGKSTAEMYRQTLLAGCRCVELDCWDGKSEDEEPIITHGMAMCTDILFKDAIIAIRDCAFVTSDYPIILSFENHCCKKQQYKLAKYCDEIFGDLLLKEPLPESPLVPGQPLPSPNQLKRKILIKNKRLKPEVEKQELKLFEQGQLELVDEDDAKEDAATTGAPLKEKLGGSVSVDSTASIDHPDVTPIRSSFDANHTGINTSSMSSGSMSNAPISQPSIEDDKPLTAEEKAFQSYQYTGATTFVHPYLSSMVNYSQPVKFQGFDIAEEKNIHHNMSSFSETAGLGYLKTQAIEFVNYNKRQMSRIYPKGARVDSSNYMPQVFWNAGCQMVSLNYQTPDLPMQLNQGKFEYNGNCGYLLKPDFMRRMDKSFDPFAESPVDGVIAAQLGVSVIAGQFLSDKKVGTYVEVDMYGLPTDTIRKEFRTRMVPANGLNPQYNEEPFLFRKVVLPDLAVLRFGVYDENGKMLGQRILPLDGLMSGYRHISLRTEGNFPMSLPMLFCNIELKIYVPDGLGELMDALSDPRAFMSAQEKREQQMKAMGIEAADINTKDINIVNKGSKKTPAGATGSNAAESKKEERAFMSAQEKREQQMKAMGIEAADINTKDINIVNKGSKKTPAGATGSNAAESKKEEREELELEPINLESLRTQKNFLKSTKKQQKELEVMRKRHMKERLSVQKQQCAAIDKASKGKKEVMDDPNIKAMVSEQMQQWSDMMERHRKEEWSMLKEHLKSQEDILKKLMEAEQANQMKRLEERYNQENKEMKAAQAKVAVETSKEVAADKTLRNKADRDRRLKEKNENNTGRFIKERKMTAIKQSRGKEKLKKIHEQQMTELVKDIKAAIEFYENTEKEYTMRSKVEFFC